MKYLGIDFGQKRVGLAISTKDERIVLPYKTLTYTSREKLILEITKIIETEHIQGVVVGLPVGLDGKETLSTRQARNFIKHLKKQVDLPVNFVDESYSSYEAEDRLKSRGMSSKKIKKVVDQMAAVEILNTYLLSRNP
ncbi:Holliday junction resolvase RuvX [Desulfothermus okinawensis JCM 13304]